MLRDSLVGLAKGRFSIHCFDSLHHKAVAVNSTSYQPDRKWRECPHLDNDHFQFRRFPLINNPIQPWLAPVSTHSPRMERLSGIIDIGICARSSYPTSDAFEEGASFTIPGSPSGAAPPEKGPEKEAGIIGNTPSPLLEVWKKANGTQVQRSMRMVSCLLYLWGLAIPLRRCHRVSSSSPRRRSTSPSVPGPRLPLCRDGSSNTS